MIAAVPGVDVIFAASTDLGNFSGHKQGEPQYETMVTKIRDATLARGLKRGGPLAWKERPGFSFFQAPGEAALIRSGAQNVLKGPPGR
jgi:2-keto-3-deoxy-L-rhamnonate aldolase RhmA